MQEHVRVRFWLEVPQPEYFSVHRLKMVSTPSQVLNLAWGDFILFEPSRTPLMKCGDSLGGDAFGI